ncbi:MAG: CYTH and CHAD domain-containing protein [Actinomycetota bacterium]|nr:CYTH and CHAD domain-containing protein [Actinomycetota bacterium]
MDASHLVNFRERELKLDVEPDWALPDLAPLTPIGGHIETVIVHLATTYFDTASRDLLAAGATLRRRTGDSDVGWQLKVPDGDARTEIRAKLNGRGMPQQLRDLVAGVRSGEPLRALATLNTERTAHKLVAADGTTLAEIDDDRVSATVFGPRRRTTAWREVEIELVDGDETLLDRASRELLRAGAVAGTSTSKLARALSRPPHDGGADVSLGGLIRRYVTEQVDALLRGDIDLRRERDVSHPTRVAIRRLRSVLHVFSDTFEPARAQAFDGELSWFAGLLGDMRDSEVLRVHLDDAVASLPSEVVVGPVSERIDRMLGSQRDQAQAVVAKAMNGPRYFALVRELKAWRDDPAFVNGCEPEGSVASRVRAASKKVTTRVRSAAGQPDVHEALHRARKAAKRARYVAELAEPSMGKSARRLVTAAKSMQERLGGHQDSVIASQFLIRAAREAGSAPGESSFTFGILWAREQEAARKTARQARRAVQ